MGNKSKTSDQIHGAYFDLHREIKNTCRHAPLDAFNPATLDHEAAQSYKSKRWFYVYSAGCIIMALMCLYIMPFFLAFHSASNAAENDIQTVRRNFALFIVLIGLCLSVLFGFKAAQSRGVFKGDMKKRLTNNAQHPAMARLIFDATQNIIDHKIPVFIIENGRARKLPLRNAFGKSRLNVMIALLGDDSHRQSLWIDGPVTKGRLLIKNSDFNKVLGDLKKSVLAHDRITKDDRDNRALVTALREKTHMQACYEVMMSDAFWKDKRKTDKRKNIIKLARVLLGNWTEWEKIRKTIRSSFTNSVHEQNRLQNLKSDLLKIYDGNRLELMDILTGKDRAAAEFFRTLQAIDEPNLVPRKTLVTS